MEEVEEMLRKGALQLVKNSGTGYYSRLFPGLDITGVGDKLTICCLNYATLTTFKRETVSSVLRMMRKEYVIFLINLKDAHFQISIHPHSTISPSSLDGRIY